MDLFEQISNDIKEAIESQRQSQTGDFAQRKEMFSGSKNRSGCQRYPDR